MTRILFAAGFFALVSGSAAFAATPDTVMSAVSACCMALAGCCGGGMPCCG